MSAGEILLIFFVALMLFGSKSLPGFAKALGQAYREFKRATDDIKQEIAQNADIASIKKDVDDIRTNLTDNISSFKDSIANEADSNKNTILNEVSSVDVTSSQPVEEPSLNPSVIEDVNAVENDYQHDVYKQAAEELRAAEKEIKSEILNSSTDLDVNTEQTPILSDISSSKHDK